MVLEMRKAVKMVLSTCAGVETTQESVVQAERLDVRWELWEGAYLLGNLRGKSAVTDRQGSFGFDCIQLGM